MNPHSGKHAEQVPHFIFSSLRPTMALFHLQEPFQELHLRKRTRGAGVSFPLFKEKKLKNSSILQIPESVCMWRFESVQGQIYKHMLESTVVISHTLLSLFSAAPDWFSTTEIIRGHLPTAFDSPAGHTHNLSLGSCLWSQIEISFGRWTIVRANSI